MSEHDESLTGEEQAVLNAPAREPMLIEPVAIPETYVDGYGAQTVTNGVLKLAFFSVRYDVHAKVSDMCVVSRLSMPLSVAVAVHQALGALLTQVEASIAEPVKSS